MISRATIGAAAPAPRRPAAWVMPTAVPRAVSEVHFESAPSGRRQCRAFAHAEHQAHGKERRQPRHRAGHDGRDRPGSVRRLSECAARQSGRQTNPDQLKRGVGVIERRRSNTERDIAEPKVLLHHARRGSRG